MPHPPAPGRGRDRHCTEPIAPPPHCFHKPCVRWLIERPPDFADARRQGRVTDVGHGPHGRNEFVFSDQLPGVRHEIAQGRKGFARQRPLLTTP